MSFLINPYVFGGSSVDVLADSIGAYSIARHIDSATYSGNIIKVRSGGGGTQDIGVDGSGNLDESALTTFLSGNDGFIHTLYDQSGNSNDFTQTTDASQPRIASAGIIDKENGKPSAVLDGVNDLLVVPSSTGIFNNLHDGTLSSVFAVVKFGEIANPNALYGFFGNNAINNVNRGICYGYDDRSGAGRNDGARLLVSNGISVVSTTDLNTVTANTQKIISLLLDVDNGTAAYRSKLYIDNGSVISTNVSNGSSSVSNATYDLQLGTAGNGSFPLTGRIQELIIKNVDTTEDREAIIENINAYYGTY